MPIDCGQTYKVGYILLPGDLFKIGDSVANWKPDELAEADELAQDVARAIVSQKFWPPAASVEYPDFERICQEAVFDRGVLT